jgi:uncharacterized protein (TIGR04255 family)
MRFPERGRVVYASNPLVEVVCQIRFPRILEIESQLPVAFQNSVGKAYPYLETRTTVTLSVSGSDPTPPRDTSVVYDFFTADREDKLVLGSDFVAVASTKYRRWEQFETTSFMP